MSKFSRDDYEESCCSVKVKSIPTDRVLDKLDEYFASDDYAGAERHIKYWMEEATSIGDGHGLLTLENECIGLYRKLNDPENAMKYAHSALELANKLGLDGTVTMATTYINVGTAYSAFERYAEALPYYEEAKAMYEALLPQNDGRLGGLYNNMALCLMALDKISQARAMFADAIDVMKNIPGGEPNMAITYCNLADLAAKEFGEIDGESRINECLDKAMELLDGASDRKDGSYAYACEKCAPSFGHYGYFVYEDALNKRARSIYEGH